MTDKTPDVWDMALAYLKEHGYDGLVAEGNECGCSLEDLAPCRSIDGNCRAAYLWECPSEKAQECHNDAATFHPYSNDEFCRCFKTDPQPDPPRHEGAPPKDAGDDNPLIIRLADMLENDHPDAPLLGCWGERGGRYWDYPIERGCLICNGSGVLKDSTPGCPTLTRYPVCRTCAGTGRGASIRTYDIVWELYLRARDSHGDDNADPLFADVLALVERLAIEQEER